jgi:hypothetical protein
MEKQKQRPSPKRNINDLARKEKVKTISGDCTRRADKFVFY